MANIHKREIINRIAERFNDSQENVKQIVDCFCQKIIDHLREGYDIEFRGFGIFRIKDRSGRRGVNPKTLEKIEVVPKKYVHFKMGKVMKEAVREEK